MEDELISFKTAMLARSAGFDLRVRTYCNATQVTGVTENGEFNEPDIVSSEDCNYNNPKYVCLVSVPTQSLLQRWLREKHNIFISVCMSGYKWKYRIDVRNDHVFGVEKLTYEECLEEALYSSLNLVEDSINPNNFTCLVHTLKHDYEYTNEKKDKWIIDHNGVEKCSYCGSVSPRSLKVLILKFGYKIVQRSHKDYLLYINAYESRYHYYTIHNTENFNETLYKLVWSQWK